MSELRTGEHFLNMREAYPMLARHVRDYGLKTSPRELDTRELIDFSFVIEDPHDALPIRINRKPSLPFAAIEAIQLISGTSHPELLTRINPTMSRFLSTTMVYDGDTTMYQHGAYGPRVGRFLYEAVARLKQDRDTRQAIITIWSPSLDYENQPDIPCTLSLQFMIRDDKLLLLTTMRSNDVWWGTAYDVFQFTQLQLTVAGILELEAGPYHHRANSFHCYEKDFDRIGELEDDTYTDPPVLPNGLDGSFNTSVIQDRGRSIIKDVYEDNELGITAPTRSELWYYDQLRHVSPRGND